MYIKVKAKQKHKVLKVRLVAIPQRTSNWRVRDRGPLRASNILLFDLRHGYQGNVGVFTWHKFTRLGIYSACTFLYLLHFKKNKFKVWICLSRSLFHEQTLVLPQCSLSLIADLFVALTVTTSPFPKGFPKSCESRSTAAFAFVHAGMHFRREARPLPPRLRTCVLSACPESKEEGNIQAG